MTYPAIFLTVCSIFVVSEIAISRLRRSDASASHQDRQSLRILWLTLTLGPMTAGFLTGVRAARMPFPLRLYAFWAGVALIVSGMAIRWVAISTLKQYFTVDVAIAKDHRVINHGLYGIVRHPSYAGTLISFVGIGLGFGNWLSLIASTAFAMAGLAYRISVEERALIEALGDDYRAYAARTKRLIPGVF